VLPAVTGRRVETTRRFVSSEALRLPLRQCERRKLGNQPVRPFSAEAEPFLEFGVFGHSRPAWHRSPLGASIFQGAICNPAPNEITVMWVTP